MAPFTPESISFQTIVDDAGLAAACSRWRTQPALALDTEFMRVSTFYPQAALFQVGDSKAIYLIDPLTISDWSPLREILIAPDVIKVLHSCSEDLLVFLSCIGVMPQPLFDTQLAAAFLDEGSSISYQSLIKLHAGIDLPKGETRSDWLQRPLTADQEVYAALDVAYLLSVWQQQTQRLQTQGRLAWLEEDSSRLLQLYASELSGNFADYYQGFKAGWQLGPRQREALRRLSIWREQRARKRDRPRSWILKDTSLFAIASSLPTTKTELAAIVDVSDNFVRFEGEQVLALLDEMRDIDEAACPPPLPKPLNQSQKARLRRVQDFIETKARELGLPNEVLVRKRLIMALYYALEAQAKAPASELQLPAEFQGWRAPLVLDELLGILHP